MWQRSATHIRCAVPAFVDKVAHAAAALQLVFFGLLPHTDCFEVHWLCGGMAKGVAEAFTRYIAALPACWQWPWGNSSL